MELAENPGHEHADPTAICVERELDETLASDLHLSGCSMMHSPQIQLMSGAFPMRRPHCPHWPLTRDFGGRARYFWGCIEAARSQQPCPLLLQS